jgi:N-acetylglucosamine kinase-like BadF-type ATPase
MNYFLGVDGGQSSTLAVIGDSDGHIAGWATAGPCNHVAQSESRAKFIRVLRECVGQAAVRAGIDAERPLFRAACLGMSGGPDDKTALLSEVFDSDHTIVTHDAGIALSGAMSGEPGVIVIAGTGSIAYGRNSADEDARAGGWGYIFGDEGGAFDIARQALRATLREHEGWGPRTALTPALLEAIGAPDANDALHRFYTEQWPRQRVAELARIVDSIAQSGDPAAIAILQTAAQNLAMLAGSVRRQLWPETESTRIAWTGGAFNSAILRERFRMLLELEDSVSVTAPAHSPAMGALFIAWRSQQIYATPDSPMGLKS